MPTRSGEDGTAHGPAAGTSGTPTRATTAAAIAPALVEGWAASDLAHGADVGDGGDGDGGFGIYVHWPFCQSKCPYCDFNSHVRHGGVDQRRYAAALGRELATLGHRTQERSPSTVFFGGGTPSLMEPGTVAAVLGAIDETFGLPADAEITLEANPSSVERRRFEGFRAAGVNRVSLGVQSLLDADLSALGRRHDAAEARAALVLARQTFPSVSADLIYARPGQRAASWRAELEAALAICGDHLSLYQLTVEPGTRYFDLAAAGKLTVPPDEEAADLFELTHEVTAAHGFVRYEVSNHARDGAFARHNLIYWRGGRYIGVGPGAHGRIAVGRERLATATLRTPEAWLAKVEANGDGIETEERLTGADVAAETLVMGLRLAEGIDLAVYERRAGAPLDDAKLDALCRDGLLARRGNRIGIPDGARLLTNAIVRELLP